MERLWRIFFFNVSHLKANQFSMSQLPQGAIELIKLNLLTVSPNVWHTIAKVLVIMVSVFALTKCLDENKRYYIPFFTHIHYSAKKQSLKEQHNKL